MTHKENQKWGIWIMAGMVATYFLLIWLSIAIINPAMAAELYPAASLFIDAPYSVDVELLESRGFVIEDNVARCYYDTYDVNDWPCGSGLIYLELPDRRFDTNADGVVNLFDCTYWLGVVYKGLER